MSNESILSVSAVVRLEEFDEAAIRAAVQERLRVIADEVAKRTIEYLRSYTDKRSPPVVAGGPWRPQHPGGWADITHDLEQSYRYHLEDAAGEGVVIVFENVSDHAVYVEAREGLFVLHGIEERGGIVATILREVAATLVPDWQVTSDDT